MDYQPTQLSGLMSPAIPAHAGRLRTGPPLLHKLGNSSSGCSAAKASMPRDRPAKGLAYSTICGDICRIHDSTVEDRGFGAIPARAGVPWAGLTRTATSSFSAAGDMAPAR